MIGNSVIKELSEKVQRAASMNKLLIGSLLGSILRSLFFLVYINNKENYQKLLHIIGKPNKDNNLFGKILNFRIYFPKSILNL